jgi:tetratricopeptide (TPR) repeat protein
LKEFNPEQLVGEGKDAYRRGDFLAAAKAFTAASESYLVAGEALKAAEIANNASVAYLQAGDAMASLQAVEGTPQIFAEAEDLRRQGMALGNQAAALEAINRLDEAIDLYQQSADVLKQAGEDQLRSNVMQSLSALQLRTGRQLEALASMSAGLEDIRHPSPKQSLLKRLLRIPFRLLDH